MKKLKLTVALSLFALTFIMVISGIIIGVVEDRNTFSGNIYINGNNVRGYTVERATKVVEDGIKSKINGININIKYGDKVWTFDESDFEVDDAVKNVVSTAFKNNKFSNKDLINMVTERKDNFTTSVFDIFKDFDKKIDNIIDEIEVEPQNATVSFQPDQKQMFVITPEENGIEVDKQALLNDLKSQFSVSKSIDIDVKTKTIEPQIKANYFDDKLSLQSKFSTSIKNSQAGRRNNVTVALKKINGTVVKPNEIVSFNRLTSPQDASGGYQNAIIILNGVYTNGMGGGICQASTTLYNALVLANLEIEEVHKHTIPVHYVEHALDAMISDGYADLIFKNTSNDDIYIKSFVKGDDAVVEIYGKSLPDGVTIKRVAEETTIPHNGDKVIVDVNGEYANKVLYKGEYYRLKWPEQGYDTTAYKEYYKGDKLIKREEIRHETYQPQQGIVIEGAQELPEGFVLPEQDVTIYPPQSEQ
ncbi:MAG TPA: hypothetical protein DCO89_01465 [Clostridiales bacterium]|nr:hypothetical protein [Clostridiales bacterium]